VSIEEVSSRQRLLAFVEKYFTGAQGDWYIPAGSYLRIGDVAIATTSGNEVILGSAATSKTLGLYSAAGKGLSIDAAGDVEVLLGDLTVTGVLSATDALGTYVNTDLICAGNTIKSSTLATVLTFSNANTTVSADLTVTGDLTINGQPAVYAYMNSEQDLNPDTNWEDVRYNDEATTNDTAFDVGSDYNTSTGVFTAPADGKYLISTEVMLTNVPTSVAAWQYILLQLITTKSAADSVGQYAGRRNPKDTLTGETDYYQIAGTWLANMAANDTASIQVRCTTADADTKIYGDPGASYTRLQIIKVA